MASVGRKWAPPILIVAAFVASLAVYGRLPEMVDLRLEGLLPFTVAHESQPARRELALFLLPALAAILWAAFRAAPGLTGQRIARRMFPQAPDEVTSPEQFERFGSTYDTIVLGVVVLVLGLHCALLAAVLQHVGLATRIVPIVLGGSLVLMGNVMPRLRPNWVAGLRTKRLLSDPQLWRTAHRAFGKAFVAAGLITVVVGAVVPRYGLLTGVASLTAALVVGFIVSTRGSSLALVSVTALGLLSAVAHVRPTEAMQGTAPVALTAPATVQETSFTFARDGLVLHGTLAEPRSRDGKMPVVLLVAGSGPTDRNGNGPLVNTNSYALLAWALAENGIASLRYDKRGIGESSARWGDPTKLSIDDYVADVSVAATALSANPRFSKVFLLGHSEGAGHVLQAANRGTAPAGVIMVSGQGRKLAEILHEQFSLQADSATVVRIDSAFARYLRGDDTGDVPDMARTVILPMYRNFMRSLAAYDPASEARRLQAPLLILQGNRDVQISLRDAQALKEAQPRATLVELTDVNHVLKSIQSVDLEQQKASYHDPSRPLAPSVVPAIVRWIRATASTGG